MVNPEIEAAARRNYKRTVLRVLLPAGAVSLAAGVLFGVFGPHHHATHPAHHISGFGQALAISLPIVILLLVSWAAWHFGRKHSWLKPSPMYALDRGSRRRVWRAARHGEALEGNEAAIVLAHADTVQRVRILSWLFLALSIANFVLFAFNGNGADRWIQLATAIIFLLCAASWRGRTSAALRVRRQYGSSRLGTE